MDEDILQEVSDEDLKLLIDLYKTRQEQIPHVYGLLKTCIKWKKQKPNLGFISVFGVGNDWLRTETFIVLIKFSYCDLLFIYTIEESRQTLRSGLSETKKVDWSRRVLWYCISGKHISIVQDFIKRTSYPTYVDYKSQVTLINRDKALQFEWTCPDEVYMGKLNKSHVAQINFVWPHKSKNSEEYLATLIEMNGSLGLFLKSNDRLVCWVLRGPMGHMCNLQTDVEHKRKGYATIIIKAMSKQIAEDGFHPFGNVRVDNVISKTMFRKLGFYYFDTFYFVMHG